jgi:hypothetical protein
MMMREFVSVNYADGEGIRMNYPCGHFRHSAPTNNVMTRRQNPESLAKEARIQTALSGFANNQYDSVKHAARECSVLSSTLQHRLDSCQLYIESHQDQITVPQRRSRINLMNYTFYNDWLFTSAFYIVANGNRTSASPCSGTQ